MNEIRAATVADLQDGGSLGGGDSVTRYLTKLEELLNGDAQRSNTFFRAQTAPK